MLFSVPRKLLSEAAAADLLDEDISKEAKETIEGLEKQLVDPNIEEVKDEDKTTNGGIPVTTEAVSLMEATGNYGGKIKYFVTIENVIAVKETEGEAAAAEKMEEPGEAPSTEECENCEPDAVNVVENIAQKNGVEPEQVAVVISSENVRFLAQTSLLESKAGRSGKDAEATRRLKKIKKTADELKGKVDMVKA